jgi:hypothetical protein
MFHTEHSNIVFFCFAGKAKGERLSSEEIAQICKGEWSKMSIEEKEKYREELQEHQDESAVINRLSGKALTRDVSNTAKFLQATVSFFFVFSFKFILTCY